MNAQGTHAHTMHTQGMHIHPTEVVTHMSHSPQAGSTQITSSIHPPCTVIQGMLQIRMSNRDNLSMVFFSGRTCCDPSLEPPFLGCSHEDHYI